MRRVLPRPRSPRRGVTLVEMLVTVALLVLMMTIIVAIFGAATGTVSAAKTYQELDGSLRQLDTTLRQDLRGATARFTPPLNPNNNLGYFEYIENAFADLQGEDTDDCLRFTAQAPEGQPFTGRVWIGPATVTNGQLGQLIKVTSDYAEIIYFLRNGNLYRRVLLVAPELQSAIVPSAIYTPAMFGGTIPVSWQGVNDLSAHPAPSANAANPIVLNTLGMLTNRENRYASPRLGNDYVAHGAPGTYAPDGIPDDENQNSAGAIIGDGVPDFWPTLYPGVFSPSNSVNLPQNLLNPNQLIYDFYSANQTASRFAANFITMPFPYIFPGMYSKPDPNSLGLGWIHSINPGTSSNNPYVTTTQPFNAVPPNTGSIQLMNHSPIDLGDSLPFPPAADAQTWWGFPTWRETLAASTAVGIGWNDPYTQVNPPTSVATGPLQPNGLTPITPPNTMPGAGSYTWLPPVTGQPNNDGFGTFTFGNLNAAGTAYPIAWEDDLIMTGVRSFDVKALDNAFGGYVDLGWGDDLRLYMPYLGANTPTAPPYLAPTPANPSLPLIPWPPLSWPPLQVAGPNTYNLLTQTFAHEGRIPPLTGDLVVNPNYPAENVGDDNLTVIRLRRTWDSWSTDYSNAPSTGFDPSTNLPTGPPFGPPVYPSYPAPYQAPLRGIQVQIRVVDPRNQRLKVLTIRQDFTDKL